MVSSRGMLVKSESTSRLPMKVSKYSKFIKRTEESLGTKNFASFELGVPIAESIGLNGEQTSVMVLCTLQSPYRIPGLLPTALIFLYCLVNKLPDCSPQISPQIFYIVR